MRQQEEKSEGVRERTGVVREKPRKKEQEGMRGEQRGGVKERAGRMNEIAGGSEGRAGRMNERAGEEGRAGGTLLTNIDLERSSESQQHGCLN